MKNPPRPNFALPIFFFESNVVVLISPAAPAGRESGSSLSFFPPLGSNLCVLEFGARIEGGREREREREKKNVFRKT